MKRPNGGSSSSTRTDGNVASYSSDLPRYCESTVDFQPIEKAWKAESNGAHSGVLAVAMAAPVAAGPAETNPSTA